MKRELVVQSALILSSFLSLTSCQKPDTICQWNRQQLTETFNCRYAKRVYCKAICPYTEPELSFVSDRCGLKSYLSVTSGCFFLRHFKQGTDISYTIDGVNYQDHVIVFRGNQMMQFSPRATEAIFAALSRGSSVEIQAGDLSVTVPAKGFVAAYSDEGRSIERWLPKSNFSFPFEDTLNAVLGR